jgi:hypothetical protein
MRAEASGISLTEEDAAVVKGMLARGDRQHDIAAWFGVNGGRIAEISTGEKFAHIAAQANGLPPPGPYQSGRDSQRAKELLSDIRASLSNYLKRIDDELTRYR